MKIVIDDKIMLRLMTMAVAYRQEFSGFGFCDIEGSVIKVYDFVLLDVGSETFTEIPTTKILKLMDRPDASKMKVWLHRHPMGSGTPGIENWSGTDNNTILTTPLGGVPELVKWSVSIVLTPRGWVGRIDNYVSHKTQHLEVEPQSPEAYDMINQVMSEKPVRDYAPMVVRSDPFGQSSQKSMIFSGDYEDIEETWSEEDDELDLAYDAMDECGISMADIVELGLTVEQFYRTYLMNRQDPNATLDDILSGNASQPYLSQEFQQTQDYLGGR